MKPVKPKDPARPVDEPLPQLLKPQPLFDRLHAAAWAASPINPAEQAASVAAIVEALPRPQSCNGQEAPSSVIYGRQR